MLAIQEDGAEAIIEVHQSREGSGIILKSVQVQDKVRKISMSNWNSFHVLNQTIASLCVHNIVCLF